MEIKPQKMKFFGSQKSKDFCGKMIMSMFFVFVLTLSSVYATMPVIDWEEEVEITIMDPPGPMPYIMPEPMPQNNFLDLPMYVYVYDTKLGDVLFMENSATLVALKNGEALYLDFNVNYNYYPIMYAEAGEAEYRDTAPIRCNSKYGCDDDWGYRVVGKVDDFIIDILESDYNYLEKQFIIWKYLGVEESALRIAWLRAYSQDKNSYIKLSKTKLFRQAEDDSIGINLENAIKKGLINIDYTANGYSSVTLNMKTKLLTKKDVVINIPLGQVFKNQGGQNQDLGVAEPVMVYLPNYFGKTVNVKTYCINARKGVPTGSDELTSEGFVPEAVKNTMTIFHAAGRASTSASQSMVWDDTDGEGADINLEYLGLAEEDMDWIMEEETTQNQDNEEDELTQEELDWAIGGEHDNPYYRLVAFFNRLRFW